MFPLQMSGGQELFMLFLMFVLMGVVPLAIAATAIYLMYRIRQDTQSMATSLERIDAEQSSAATAGDSVEIADGDSLARRSRMQ